VVSVVVLVEVVRLSLVLVVLIGRVRIGIETVEGGQMVVHLDGRKRETAVGVNNNMREREREEGEFGIILP